jgi:hypothetical protein
MNKTGKIITGILTFLPLFVAIFMMGFAIYQILSIFTSEDPFMSMMAMSYLEYVFPLMIFFLLFYVGLEIFYIVQIVQNNLLDTEKKLLWIAVIITINAISMPLYWYFHIWKRPKPGIEHHPAIESNYESGTEPQKF